MSPFLATMSFAGYFHVRFLLSAFFPTVFVPGLIWCNSLYLVTTAGLVADQSFSETLRVQYGEDGMGRRKSGLIASKATSGRLA